MNSPGPDGMEQLRRRVETLAEQVSDLRLHLVNGEHASFCAAGIVLDYHSLRCMKLAHSEATLHAGTDQDGVVRTWGAVPG